MKKLIWFVFFYFGLLPSQNVDKRAFEPGAADVIQDNRDKVVFTSENESQPCFVALRGRRDYERAEDLRCHLEETPWGWSSGGPSASSCGAPHPKLGIYSGGMSGSGGWQVSGPMEGGIHCTESCVHFQLLYDVNWKESVSPAYLGSFSTNDNNQTVKPVYWHVCY